MSTHLITINDQGGHQLKCFDSVVKRVALSVSRLKKKIE